MRNNISITNPPSQTNKVQSTDTSKSVNDKKDGSEYRDQAHAIKAHLEKPMRKIHSTPSKFVNVNFVRFNTKLRF